MGTDLAATTGTWQIDPTHSTVGFVARHAMIAKVCGGFTEFTGMLTLDGADPAKSSAVLTIVTSSFTSSNDERDAHVKSADFLDVDQFPTLTFTSTAVTHKDDEEFIVTGDLVGDAIKLELDIEAVKQA